MQQSQNDTLLAPCDGLASGWADVGDALDDTQLWLRWGAAEICYVRVLSAEPLHYWGHWLPAIRAYRRCQTPGCQYCGMRRAGRSQTSGIASERRVRYLCSVQRHTGAVALWEFGDAVAKQMQQLTGYAAGSGAAVQRTTELRGLGLSLRREGGRQSGSVLVDVAPALDWSDGLPAPLPATEIMAELWRRAALHDGKGQAHLPFRF